MSSVLPFIEPGKYYHYKDPSKIYEVLGVAKHTETEEDVVVYKPLHKQEGKPDMWVRPYNMFIGGVTVDGIVIPRFVKIDG